MNTFDKLLSSSINWQIIIKALMLFLAGSVFIGFLSEYATYWYALNQNIRPPVEGIPYLSATVAFGCLLLALSVSIVFLLSRLVVAFFVGIVIEGIESNVKLPSIIVKFLKKFFNFKNHYIEKLCVQISDTPHEIKKLTFIHILVCCLLLPIILFGMYYINDYGKSTDQGLISPTLVSLYFIVILLTLWRKFMMQVVAFIAAILFYGYSVLLMFDQNHYSEFLKLTSFGGNQVISLQLKSEKEPVDMNLILRSKDWFIGHSIETGESIEIPNNTVKQVTYKQ